MLGGKTHQPHLVGKWGFSFFWLLDSNCAPNSAELSRNMMSAGRSEAWVSSLSKGMLDSLRALVVTCLMHGSKHLDGDI